MFFVAAASAAAIDDGDKKQDKRGVLGVGYGLHAPIAAPLAAPYGAALAAPYGAPLGAHYGSPLAAYHAPLPLAAPAIGKNSRIKFVEILLIRLNFLPSNLK